METESETALTSAHEEAEVITRRISLLEGELMEVWKARDAIELNSRGLSNMVANDERR
jgi:hypothetical protein